MKSDLKIAENLRCKLSFAHKGLGKISTLGFSAELSGTKVRVPVPQKHILPDGLLVHRLHGTEHKGKNKVSPLTIEPENVAQLGGAQEYIIA